MPAEAPLRFPYQRYVTGVSHPAHAISLQLAFYLWDLVDSTRPSRVADLGSGFSSYVLRLYAKNHAPEMEVWSVDDDAGWLEKTRVFLDSEDVSTDNLVLWEDFGEHSFDCVLHDLGTMDTREATLSSAIGLVRPGGALVLDDLQMPSYRQFVEQSLERRGIAYESARDQTYDLIGRYSWIAFPGRDH